MRKVLCLLWKIFKNYKDETITYAGKERSRFRVHWWAGYCWGQLGFSPSGDLQEWGSWGLASHWSRLDGWLWCPSISAPRTMSRLSPLLQPEPDLSQRITDANRAIMSMGMANAKMIEAGAHRVCHTVSIQNGSLLSFLGTACHHPISRSPRWTPKGLVLRTIVSSYIFSLCAN